MGDPAPTWDGSLGDHVKNDFAASNEPWIAVRRARPGPEVWAEFVEVTRTRLAQEVGLSKEEWAAVGWTPSGSAPTRSSWRCASSTAGCTSRMCGVRSTVPGAAGTWPRPWR